MPSGVAAAKGPVFPLGGNEQENNDKQATATCYCGAVQIAFVRVAIHHHHTGLNTANNTKAH